MNVTISSRSGSNSAMGKGCASVFFGVFAVIGLVFLSFVAKSGWETVRTYSWAKTDCVIESSAMVEKGDGAEFTVRYAYRYGGRNYTGTRYQSGMSASTSAASAQRAVQRYAAGRPAYCYVNEAAPAESTLERGSLWMLLFGLIPLVFVAVGVGGIIATWRAKPRCATPVSERVNAGRGAVLGMRILGGVFIALGGGLLYAIFFRPMLKEMAAVKWPVVPCEIVSSKVGAHSGSKGGSTYSVDVRYRYQVGGREFIGTNYNFDSGTSSSLGWREDAVAALPPGKKTACYVNPEDPLDAVLSVKPSPDRWFGLIPGLFLIAGLAIFFSAKKVGVRRDVLGQPLRDPNGGLPRLLRSEASPLHGGATGEVELKQSTPPGCAFAALAVFALIWNGFVWFMVSSMKGESWGPRLFMGIFVLAGIGIALAAFYQFLALFNPRPVLIVSTSAVPLGGALSVRWRFTGNARRLAKLTVSLRAREEATYRRGTTTSTDKSVFLDSVLFETADHAQMSGGSVETVIPRHLIHTFTATNNKVIWLLHVQGDIPKWPDVDADFPITVLPRDTATLFQEQPPAS